MKKWLLALALSAGLVSTGNAADINRLKTFTGTASQWPWQLNTDGTWTLKQPDASDVTFTQSGTGALTRNLQAKTQEIVTATDFATCSGISTDTTGIQNALNALAAKGGTLLIPNGAVCTVAGLTWANSTSLVIQGAGIGSKLVIGATSGNMLSVTNGSVDIENLTAQYATPGTVTSGYFFSFVGARGVLRNVTFYNGFSLAYWGDAASGSADNVSATGMSGDGFKVDVSPSTIGQQYGIMKFSGLKFQGTSINNGSGLNLVSGDSIVVSDSNIAGFKINVNATTSASRSYLANLFFTNVLADGAGGLTSTFFGWYFDGTNQFLGRVYISNSWANYMPGGWGIYVKNASTISIKDSQISANDKDGIYLDTGAADVQINGNTISGNSASSSGTYHGIRAVAGANKIYIRDNIIGPTQSTNTAGVNPDTQKYAISISDASITNYEITTNQLTGNTAGQIQDLGGGTDGVTKLISRNITGSAQTETFAAAPVFTTLNGLLKGNGASAISAAVSGTDYLAPNGSGAALTGITGPQIGGFTSCAIPYADGSGNLTQNASLFCYSAGRFFLIGDWYMNAKFGSATAPTIASGFCTSPAIASSNGTLAFEITIGSACAASTGQITLPAAAHKWVCDIHNLTTPASNKPDMSASTTTDVTFTNYSRTTGAATNWTAAETLVVKCAGY